MKTPATPPVEIAPREASDRAIFKRLQQTAADSGRLTEPDPEWQLALAELLPLSKHLTDESVLESLNRLMHISVTVHHLSPRGRQCSMQTTLLQSIETDYGDNPTVRYRIPKPLRALLAFSPLA